MILKFIISLTLSTTLFFPINSLAFPTTEKLPASGELPLDILSSQPTGAFIPPFGSFANEYLITFIDNTLTIISLETWSEHLTQPDSFEDDVVDVDLLGDGETLVVALANGNVATLDLNDETSFVNENADSTSDLEDSRIIESAILMTDAGLSKITTDPSSTTTLYMINEAGSYYELNISTEELIEVELLSSTDTDEFGTGSALTPTDIAFLESIDGDKIVISTEEGSILEGAPGAFSFSEITATARDEDDNTPSFSAIAAHPSGDFVFALDDANDFIWVYSLSANNFIDQQSGGFAIDPLEISDNNNFSHLAFFGSESAENVTLYVAGGNGITLINGNDPQIISSSKILDLVELSGRSELLTVSSNDSIFSMNGNAEISLLTENPYVSLSTVSEDVVSNSAPSFDVTFQADTTGTYTIKLNSNPSGSEGTTVVSSTVIDTANSDITVTIDTSTLSTSVFTEGRNRFFIFVTDSEDRTGVHAFDITLDNPPEQITTTSVTFGNEKALVDFVAVDEIDVASYTIYAQEAANQSNPSCSSDSIDTSDTFISATFDATECTASASCKKALTGLTNGITYCIGVSATDESSQESVISVFSTPVTPQRTIGIAEALGETGCHLNTANTSTSNSLALLSLLALPQFLILFTRLIKTNKNMSLMLVLMGMFFATLPTSTMAKSSFNADGNGGWSFEFRTGLWIPTNSSVKEAFGTCCQFPFEAEIGWLFENNIHITFSAGFMTKQGDAVSADSGIPSGDKFRMTTIPLRADIIYRFAYKDKQRLVPFLRAGVDSVLFQESGGVAKIRGNKFGVHGGGGLSIFISDADENSMNADWGVKSVYLNLEGRYSYINSFSSTGMDFSGIYPYVGVLFLF